MRSTLIKKEQNQICINVNFFKRKSFIHLIARTPSFWTECGDMVAIKVAPIINARIPTPNSNCKAVLTFLALTISAVVIPSCNVCGLLRKAELYAQNPKSVSTAQCSHGTGLPLFYDVALVQHGFLRLTKVSVSAESIRI